MAPVVKELEIRENIISKVCVTGQHREMLDQVLNLFSIKPHYDLDVMQANQSLNGLMACIISKIDVVLEKEKPDWVLVHGDTTTSMAAGLSAFHRRIKVGHVEAGLRTHDLSRPWPEELNRRVVDIFADLMFAPTIKSKNNLVSENINNNVIVTGNTVIDALMSVLKRLNCDSKIKLEAEKHIPILSNKKNIILVTGHRRENFGDGFLNICEALAEIAKRDDIEIVYPVHLNPNVQEPVNRLLGGCHNIHLIPPLDYLPFVEMMSRAAIILTDSGGVQEEAPALGKPVLVMRDVTERPEAVEAGVVQLIGTEKSRIIHHTTLLLDKINRHENMRNIISPYGDGFAAKRIVAGFKRRSCR